MKTFISFIALILSVSAGNAQTTFEKIYNNKLMDASGSGVTMGGPSPLTHNLSSAVKQTNDGGYISVGMQFDSISLDQGIEIFKTNQYGNVSWVKRMGGVANDFGRSIEQTSDGGFIIAGGTESIGAGGMDIQLTKLDSTGNEVWTKVFGMSGNEEAQSVKQTVDGGFIIAGKTNSSGSGMDDIYMVKTDSNGTILWTKVYGGNDDDLANDVIVTADGGYLVAGATNSFGAGNTDAYLIRLDGSGNRMWEKTIGDAAFNSAQSVLETVNGEFVFVGSTMSFGNSDVYLAKLSAGGAGLWTLAYGGANTEKGNHLVATNDGYILAGETGSYGAGGSDVLLLKADENGQLLFAKTFGSAENEYATCISKTNDGGFVLGGCMMNTAGSESVYIIKTDSLALTSCGGADAGVAVSMIASAGWVPTAEYVNTTSFTTTDSLIGSSTISNFGMTVNCSNEPADPTPSVNLTYTQYLDPTISEDSSFVEKSIAMNIKDSLRTFSVYPNPSDGTVINISMNTTKAESIFVVVYDMLGKEKYSHIELIENEGTNVFAIDPSGMLQPGMYMITATSNAGTLSKKLIIK